MYVESYALDYRRNLAYTVASWILISRGRRFDPPYFGDRRHCGNNQTCHWARSIGDRIAKRSRVKPGLSDGSLAWNRSRDGWTYLL